MAAGTVKHFIPMNHSLKSHFTCRHPTAVGTAFLSPPEPRAFTFLWFIQDPRTFSFPDPDDPYMLRQRRNEIHLTFFFRFAHSSE